MLYAVFVNADVPVLEHDPSGDVVEVGDLRDRRRYPAPSGLDLDRRYPVPELLDEVQLHASLSLVLPIVHRLVSAFHEPVRDDVLRDGPHIVREVPFEGRRLGLVSVHVQEHPRVGHVDLERVPLHLSCQRKGRLRQGEAEVAVSRFADPQEVLSVAVGGCAGAVVRDAGEHELPVALGQLMRDALEAVHGLDAVHPAVVAVYVAHARGQYAFDHGIRLAEVAALRIGLHGLRHSSDDHVLPEQPRHPLVQGGLHRHALPDAATDLFYRAPGNLPGP